MLKERKRGRQRNERGNSEVSEECRECYLHLLRKYSSHQSHCYFYFSLIIILCASVNLFLCIPLSKLKRSRERCFTFFVWSVGTVMDSCTSNFLLIQCFLIFVSSTHLIKVNILTENSFVFKENLISFLLNFKFKHFFFWLNFKLHFLALPVYQINPVQYEKLLGLWFISLLNSHFYYLSHLSLCILVWYINSAMMLSPGPLFLGLKNVVF